MKALTITLSILVTLAMARANPAPESVRHFPPGADILLGVEWQAFLQAPLVKSLKAKGEIEFESEDLEKAKQVLGIDLMKDLGSLTVGLALTDDEDMPVKDWIVTLQGNFGSFHLDALIGMLGEKAKDLKLKNVKIHGQTVRLLDLPPDKHRKEAMQVGLVKLDDSTLAAGSREYLQSYLAARAGKGQALSASSGLGAIVSRVSPDATFWLAANPERVAKRIKAKHKSRHLKNFPEIEDLLITGRIHRDLSLSATARTADEETARNLRDACRGLVALAKLLPHDEQELRELVEGIEIKTGEREVTLQATLPGRLIESHH